MEPIPGLTNGEMSESLRILRQANRRRRRKGVADRIVFDWMGWDVHPKDEERIEAVTGSLSSE